MDKEQILALAEEQGAVANLKQHFNMAGDSIVFTPKELEAFYHAAIESYKAELLKEVGEPVAFMCSDEELCHKGYERFSRHNSGEWNIPIFTSDQVAAAILKATKPLEEELQAANTECEMFRKNGRISDANEIAELRTQLAAAQEANEHWQRATAENENKWIEANDKLATAEQRVAEACALQVATEIKFHWLDAARVAKEIRSGEWSKFLKEEV